MSQIVAINGDCEAIPSFVGFWNAGPIIYTDAIKISVGGTKVITMATCVFTSVFTPPFVDTVILTPGATKLTDNGTDVLRVGDSKRSAQGNTLRVKNTITNKLKSS